MKINITTDDEYQICNITYLVDQDEFLKDVGEVRKKFGLDPDNLPADGDDTFIRNLHTIITDKKKSDLAHKKVERIDKKLCDLNQVYDMSHEERERLFNEMVTALREIDWWEDFDFTVRDLRKKYHRSSFYDSVITSAIVWGSVSGYTPYATAIIQPEAEYPQFFQDPKLAIVISPNIREDDLWEAKLEAQKLFDEYKKQGLFPQYYFPRALPKIKKEREMYWFQKENPDSSSSDLLDLWQAKCEGHKTADEDKKCKYCSVSDYGTISKAIKDYKKWLNGPKTSK